ncbi:MAG: hypothetical protein ACOX8S_12775 [Christensenellales bacterium]|jgi:hypothetical protein
MKHSMFLSFKRAKILLAGAFVGSAFAQGNSAELKRRNSPLGIRNHRGSAGSFFF